MNSRSSRSGLFLIELIIAILFFSLGSAVCVQAFVKAHKTGEEAKNLSFASAQASSAASVLKYTDGSFSSFRRFFPDAEKQENEFLVYYSADRQISELRYAEYILYVKPSIRNGMRHADIRMIDSRGKEIYKLKIRFDAPSSDSSGKEASHE